MCTYPLPNPRAVARFVCLHSLYVNLQLPRTLDLIFLCYLTAQVGKLRPREGQASEAIHHMDRQRQAWIAGPHLPPSLSFTLCSPGLSQVKEPEAPALTREEAGRPISPGDHFCPKVRYVSYEAQFSFGLSISQIKYSITVPLV